MVCRKRIIPYKRVSLNTIVINCSGVSNTASGLKTGHTNGSRNIAYLASANARHALDCRGIGTASENAGAQNIQKILNFVGFRFL